MSIHKQLIILALLLLSYFFPWQLFSGDLPADWLASVITMQAAFVMACNIISRESWVTAIIIIETICMVINILMLIIPATISPYQQNIMATALIIEMLMITISLQGATIECSGRLRMAGNSLRGLRYFSLRNNSGGTLV